MVAPPFLTLPALVLAGFLWTLPSQAHGYGQCMPRDVLVGELKKDWDEDPVYWGMVPNGAIIELFLSSNNERTFSIIITRPTGISCMLVGGGQWERITPPPVGEPA